MTNLERRLPWIITALALLAAVAGYVASRIVFSPGTHALPLAGTLLYPEPRPLPDFRLQRDDGSALTQADWRGRWRLLFFGFTHCPDVCPTTLATAKAALAALRKDHPDARVAVSFVSVDPERDTPDKLGAYVHFFDPAFEAATGTQEQLQALTRALWVVYEKVPGTGGPGDYSIDHSASLLLIDPQGRLVGQMRPPQRADVIAADLALLIQNAPE
ncbi:MAG: SCO family protein [Xanthomonadales bacterium]|nr:hypothetical protein [Xanthomonadales bacterium]MCC6591912.1 SCO family protein [Xanthomonadales bacterium]MCE7930054.1 SCO family protein [Xanthomonadales bacterium PRO6]